MTLGRTSPSTPQNKEQKQIKLIELAKREPYSIIDNIIYKLSDKPKHKLKALINGEWIYFGNPNYQNYYDKSNLLPKYYNHLDEERRRKYLLRASKIRDKNGNLTAYNKNSPNYHSINILW
jgi:hypothetical protein